MKPAKPFPCAMCGAAAADAPRLTVNQERHFDCPRVHQVGLCSDHGTALRAGELAPHAIVYEWTQRHHDELYDGTRLMLIPGLTCLACNAELVHDERDPLACPKCGALNRIGSALGHPAAVRLEP